jgi:ribonuclease BN (tRNA processing enzyme)
MPKFIPGAINKPFGESKESTIKKSFEKRPAKEQHMTYEEFAEMYRAKRLRQQELAHKRQFGAGELMEARADIKVYHEGKIAAAKKIQSELSLLSMMSQLNITD